MSAVSFVSEQTDFSLSNQNQFIDWLAFVCQAEGKTLAELTYIFCTDEYLLAINKKHLSHDYYTDVITFDYSDEKSISGDIFISVDRVRENAITEQVSEGDEMARIIVHGLLHLLGYNDKTPSQKDEMTLKEDFYLSSRAF